MKAKIRAGIISAIFMVFWNSSSGLTQDSNFTFFYDVGPGQPYTTPSDVPWEALQPGTLVRIHYRETPYNDKWVVAVAGTALDPVVIRGVPQGGGAAGDHRR